MQTRRGTSLVQTVTVLTTLSMLAAVAAPVIKDAQLREKLSKSGKNVSQFIVAQQNFATDRDQKGQPIAFVRGTEGFCYANADGTPGMFTERATVRTDGSRAFMFLTKRSFIDTLEIFASPADPFVAPLTLKSSDFANDDNDFPKEAVKVADKWAAADSPARKEDGHTYYSYSMQAGSWAVQINLGPKMLASLPVISDRNPWSEPTTTLAKKSPDDGHEKGNTWNNNREGQVYAQRDGSVFFLTDARDFVMPASATAGAAPGKDYIYGNTEIVAGDALPKPVGLKYTGVGEPSPVREAKVGWNCWMYD